MAYNFDTVITNMVDVMIRRLRLPAKMPADQRQIVREHLTKMLTEGLGAIHIKGWFDALVADGTIVITPAP